MGFVTLWRGQCELNSSAIALCNWSIPWVDSFIQRDDIMWNRPGPVWSLLYLNIKAELLLGRLWALRLLFKNAVLLSYQDFVHSAHQGWIVGLWPISSFVRLLGIPRFHIQWLCALLRSFSLLRYLWNIICSTGCAWLFSIWSFLCQLIRLLFANSFAFLLLACLFLRIILLLMSLLFQS